MTKSKKTHKFVEAPRLSANEQQKIDKKIEFETSKSFHSMVKLGALSNIIGAFLYVLAIYNLTKPTLILTWYAALVFANFINVIWALRFEYTNITPEEISKCRRGFLFIIVLICLIWSSIGILFIDNSVQQQITTIVFLSAVLICFSFSTAIDLTMTIVSIICLLVPPIAYHLYLAVQTYHTVGDGNQLHIAICTAFFVLGIFMLIASYVGNKVVLKVFRLGYENALLSKRLEELNTFLERRVKERTIELESSLKLVTYQATHDLLTELPNERLLNDYLHDATERAVKKRYKFAIACFSLNGMIKISDGIGHQAAANVTRLVAQRFTNVFKDDKKYFISLLRQDIFVILIEPIFYQQEIEQYMEELFVILHDPIYVNKQSLKLTGSIGVSVFPDDGRDVDTLITNAEAARTLAEESGGNSARIYNTIINADASKKLNIENQLYHAIENNELILNYQPFIDTKTGVICGAEALVRWNSPMLGLISPLDFIPIAETNGMILPIGEWVLRNACVQLKEWHDKGFKSFSMSVNLSAKQLEQKNLVDCIQSILKNLHLDPKYLELELTESKVFRNDAIPIIHQFTEMGISLAIDDFGTGYSEFSSLKLFQVDKIKIDRSFIQDIDVSIDSKNIVCNTIALAKRMKIECLAEGVETIEQVRFLKEYGCSIMQGYYFSRPLSADDFLEYLKNYPKNRKV